MQDVRCDKCGRLLAKQDQDGTIHIKTGGRGTEVIAQGGKYHLICPKVTYIDGKAVYCRGKIVRESNKEVVNV